MLAWLKREEQQQLVRLEDFGNAADSARSVQYETLGLDDEAEDA